MATLKLNGDTSGYVLLQAASVAQNNTLTLPNTTDTLLVSTSPVMSNATITASTLLSSTLINGTLSGTFTGGTLSGTTLSSPTIVGTYTQQNLNLAVPGGAIVTNGIYLPFDNTLSLVTNTTERLRITSAGNLLVNSNPRSSVGNSTVVISGLGTNGGGVQLAGGAAGGVILGGLNGGGQTVATYTGALGSETASERMRLDSNGNLGVGVSTLSLGGRLNVGRPSLPSFTGAAAGVITVSDTSSSLNSYTAIDFTNTNQQLPLARVAMQFTSLGSYLSLGTTNSYGSGVTNSAMTIDPSGNVGVGTAAVRYPLDVYGNIHLGNTGVISGIVFSDGTFQRTAASGSGGSPSFGAPGTVQFAGAGNTYAGNTSSFFWDSTNIRLGVGTTAPLTTLQVGGNMNANNFTTDPSGVIQSMNKTISTVYTIPTNQNAFSVGNIQLAPGANVTVQPGTRWVII